jgi:hypothetical protein
MLAVSDRCGHRVEMANMQRAIASKLDEYEVYDVQGPER